MPDSSGHVRTEVRNTQRATACMWVARAAPSLEQLKGVLRETCGVRQPLLGQGPLLAELIDSPSSSASSFVQVTRQSFRPGPKNDTL